MINLGYKQTFEFKLTTNDDGEISIKKTFPDGTDMDDMAELFKVFLNAIGYTEGTIFTIIKDDK